MCGLLGLVAPVGSAVDLDASQTRWMREAMAARGPDGFGSYRHRNIVFEHRRLAIRDAAGGLQPWVSDDGQSVLVYNGEIYNDGELRAELGRLGHQFRSRCDTEVLLAAWRQWGPECVERLRGMFALGVYDFRDETLFLARDRSGVKPLFYAERDGTLIFASSVAAILRHPRFTAEPHWPAVSHYLTTFRITLGRETLYSGIRQLLPGECLHWKRGEMQIRRYWDYPAEEEPDLHYHEAVELLDRGLRNAVDSQLVSDVPVGMFLSGGVDSSTLACLLRETSPRPMRAECGGGDSADDPSPDFAAARACAAHVEFDYDEMRVGPDEYLDRWQWMIAQTALPLATPTDVIIYELARSMKRHVGVVLGGEGADELLCGYAVPHWAGRDFELSQQLAADCWSAGPAAARIFCGSLQRQYGRARFRSAVEHYFCLNSLIPSAAKPSLLQPWVWKAADGDRSMHATYAALLEERPEQSALRRSALVLHRVNLESLLSRLDSATMLASLEARVPYTDHALIETMFRVPSRFKIDVSDDEHAPWLASAELERRGSLRSKRILRSLADRLMPAGLARRRKASFPTPVASWLSGRWQEWARHRLLSSPFGQRVFQPAALRELAENLPQAGMWLWPLLNVLCWGDRQFAGCP